MIWPLASAFSRRSWNETTATKMVVLTTDEVLQKGLSMVGFDRDRQKNVSRETNLQRFRAHYGSNPIVYAQIWEDLSLLTETDAWKMDPDSFLMACHFLTRYPTEHSIHRFRAAVLQSYLQLVESNENVISSYCWLKNSSHPKKNLLTFFSRASQEEILLKKKILLKKNLGARLYLGGFFNGKIFFI
jgi:hypothetical protein